MTPDERAHLVNDIISTWPAGARAHVWTTMLTDHDITQPVARGVYEHLRDHAERPPTPGQFLELCRATTPSYGWTRPDDTGPPISLAEYLARHDDAALRRTRDRHPSSA